MAPQNKREADSSSGGDKCKKIKEEQKQKESPIVENDDAKVTSNNNNNNISSSDSKANNNQSQSNPTNGDSCKVDNFVSDKSTNGSLDTKSEEDSKSGDNEKKVTTETELKEEKKTEETPKVDEKNKKSQEEKEKTKVDDKNDTHVEEKDDQIDDDDTIGTLLLCGGANWDMTGRKELPKAAKKPVEVNPAARNLWGPHRVRLPGAAKPLRVNGIYSGCNACHSVIVTDDGQVMTFGRNDKGQLGVGDTETKTIPIVVEKLQGINIVAAACGRSHTLFLDSDGLVYATGDNKMGQLGIDKPSIQQITTPQRIVFKEAKKIVKLACGAEFSMILDSDGRLYSFGHPEHGQLGHNSEGKYFTSGNKYAFHCEYVPRRICTYISKTREGHITPVEDVKIVEIACGTNHTLAVDSKGRCFSWGFAGYHRLGHSETKNELVPRSIKVFEAPNSSERGAVRVCAGSSHSMAVDVHGVLYFWGQNKSSGEATMYPKVVQDLCGWKITSLSCANRSIFLASEGACVSWGPSPTFGELGYGEGRAKSSTTPDEVKTLDGVHVMRVACGHGHTLLIARDSKPEDQKGLSKLSFWP